MRMRRTEVGNGKMAESNRIRKMEEKPQIYNRWNSVTPLSKFNTSCDASVRVSQETVEQKPKRRYILKTCRWETNPGRVKFSSGPT